MTILLAVRLARLLAYVLAFFPNFYPQTVYKKEAGPFAVQFQSVLMANL